MASNLTSTDSDASEQEPRAIEENEKTAFKPRSALAWLPYVLPLFVYMLSGYFELDGISFPLVYAIRIGLTLMAAIIAVPVYRAFRFRVIPLSLVVGIVGGIVWIVLCRLNLEASLSGIPILGGLVGSGERAAFNPFVQLEGQPLALAMFLAIRFFGLVLLIPLIEEFFLRGFLMRFVIDGDWPQVAFGSVTAVSVIVGTVYGVVAHPAEFLAAAVWFSLITWLMIRTRNIWDCVAAHAVTNLVLGLYVVVWQDWRLW